MIGGGVKAEAEQSMKNLGAILRAAGASYENGEKGAKISFGFLFHLDFGIYSCEGHYSAGGHGRLSSGNPSEINHYLLKNPLR